MWEGEEGGRSGTQMPLVCVRNDGSVVATFMLILSELMDPSISTFSDSLRDIMTGFKSTSFDFPASTWGAKSVTSLV